MEISAIVKNVIAQKGTTQTWVIAQMNRMNSSICMNRSKFSSIVCGTRKMTGDELLAFCQAVGVSPDIFLTRDIRLAKDQAS